MKKKLLLVDDDKGIRILYKGEFEDEGYEVMTAATGVEGLEIFKERRPDLVILDLQMPEVDGIEVLRQMKEHDSSVPVILSTAYQDYKQDFAAWACEEYVAKSTNLDNLKIAVKKYIGKDVG